MDFETITEFNEYLLTEDKYISVNEYINSVIKIYNADINEIFVEYYINLLNHSEEFYIKYRILKNFIRINNNDEKYNLEDHGLKYYQDFNLINDNYMLTPDGFKIYLLNSCDALTYIKSYLILDKSIKHYLIYKKELIKKQLDKKLRTITCLKNEIKNLKIKNNNLKDELEDCEL